MCSSSRRWRGWLRWSRCPAGRPWWIRVWARWWPPRSCAGCMMSTARSASSIRPLVLQAPAGVGEADVTTVLQAVLDRHATLRLRVADDGAGGWSLMVPEVGSVAAGACIESVSVLSDEALAAARSRLEPAAGVMVHALWVPDTGSWRWSSITWPLMGCRGGSCWKTSTSPGRSTSRAGDRVAGRGTSFARWSAVLEEYAHSAGCWSMPRCGGRVVRTPAVLPAVQPERDTFATAGRSSVRLDAEITRQVLGEVPAAFHAGVQDILLIAFGLAWAEFWAPGPRRSASTSRATAVTRRSPATMSICRARWAGSPRSTRSR